MKKFTVTLKDCYGIGNLQHTFDFDIHPGAGHSGAEHSQTNIIYARNGVMKTSFAKTLLDYSEDREPVDNLYGRSPYISIEADGAELDRKCICVLQSSEEYFETENMATLLSNKEDQKRYAEIMSDIELASDELFDAVAGSMGLRGGAAKAIGLFDAHFQGENYNRLIRIKSMKNEVEAANPDMLRVEYAILDNVKVADFLDRDSTKKMLKSYAEAYEQVLRQSKYFQDGIFDYANAFSVHKSLNDNNFMNSNVGNKVIIVTKNKEETVIDSVEKLREEYEKDKNQIFESLERQVEYDKFDKEISRNADLRRLQSWVRTNKDLVPHLLNYQHAKTLVWYAYFAEHMTLYNALLRIYDDHKKELEELIARSRSFESEWKGIVDGFKESFRPKFDIEVRNQSDVVLKSEKPELVFIYHDDRGGVPREVSVSTLNGHILSTGERRALYILCMMFEVRVRMLSGEDTVLVLDDIADSFDYKNKYAIIEYLYDLSVDYSNNIYMIILTHNYDFFRALRARCQMHYHTSPKVFTARRSHGEITLEGGVHTKEFERLKSEASRGSTRAFFSLIPLARNLVEYQQGEKSEDYTLFTKVMHNKQDSAAVTVAQIVQAVEKNIAGVCLSMHSSADSIQEKIITEADKVQSDGQDGRLEDKIVLALGIRLYAEKYIKYIYGQDGIPLKDAKGQQTGRWYAKYVKDYPKSEAIATLKLVNIVTPETLHINMFMYEPIIDMDIDELKDLYSKVAKLPQ